MVGREREREKLRRERRVCATVSMDLWEVIIVGWSIVGDFFRWRNYLRVDWFLRDYVWF